MKVTILIRDIINSKTLGFGLYRRPTEVDPNDMESHCKTADLFIEASAT